MSYNLFFLCHEIVGGKEGYIMHKMVGLALVLLLCIRIGNGLDSGWIGLGYTFGRLYLGT